METTNTLVRFAGSIPIVRRTVAGKVILLTTLALSQKRSTRLEENYNGRDNLLT